MASGSSYEEVKNAEISLPCPGILLMFISGGHTSIYERFEVTNGVFRSRNSQKDRQYNNQKKRDKATKQWSMKSVHRKLFTDMTARTTLKTGNESKCSARIQLSCYSIQQIVKYHLADCITQEVIDLRKWSLRMQIHTPTTQNVFS